MAEFHKKQHYQCFQLKVKRDDQEHEFIIATTRMPRREIFPYLRRIAAIEGLKSRSLYHLLQKNPWIKNPEGPTQVGFMSSRTLNPQIKEDAFFVQAAVEIVQSKFSEPIVVCGLTWESFQILQKFELANDRQDIPPPSMN